VATDLHEARFLQRLEQLPPFTPAQSVSPEMAAVDFPAWRAFFTALLMYGHSTGYRLPSFDEFTMICERGYRHSRHQNRFAKWFADDRRNATLQRFRRWYEAGMTETYLYVCLVDAFEDILRDGVVLYDARADWKLKWDAVVIRRDRKFIVSAFWGHPADRDEVELRRERVERIRKENTSLSSHWDNIERANWTELRVAVSDQDCQRINGVRLVSVAAVNEVLREIYAHSGDGAFYFPESRQERNSLYRSLLGGTRARS
jgi:hypothetical protein